MDKNKKIKKLKVFKRKSLKLISPLYFNELNCFYYEVRKYSFFRNFVKDQNDFKPKEEEFIFLNNFITTKREELNQNDNENNMINILPIFREAIFKLKELPLMNNPIYKNIENILLERNLNCNISISKIKEIYKKKYGLTLSRTKIHRIIRNKLHFSFKKTILKPRNLENNTYKKMSFLFIKCMIRAIKLNFNFVFIDESCFKLKNNNFKNWIKSDDFAHYGYSNNSNAKKNFLLAVGTKSIINFNLCNKNTNSDLFIEFFEDTIKKLPEIELKKTLFVMDNLSSHISKKMKKIISEKSLKVLYTVPYESIFNPIELAFRGIKVIIYKNIYNNLTCLEKDIKKIIFSERFKTTLFKNFLETLEKYNIFIKKNKDFDMNQ